jgi:predicted DNA-binding transcriptional regulator AlpA
MDEPIAISIAECARLLSVTRKHVYTLIDTDPDFPRTFKLGRCTRVMRSEVLQYIANKAKRPTAVAEILQLRASGQRVAGRARSLGTP